MRFIQGEFAGIKKNTITPSNSPAFDQYSVGVHISKIGGFQGEKETVEIKLTKDAPIVEYEKLAPGDRVVIPFFITARSWNDRAFITHMTSDGPRVVK